MALLLVRAQVHGMEVTVKVVVCGETSLALIEVGHVLSFNLKPQVTSMSDLSLERSQSGATLKFFPDNHELSKVKGSGNIYFHLWVFLSTWVIPFGDF